MRTVSIYEDIEMRRGTLKTEKGCDLEQTTAERGHRPYTDPDREGARAEAIKERRLV
jgi:hypothetical protein